MSVDLQMSESELDEIIEITNGVLAGVLNEVV